MGNTSGVTDPGSTNITISVNKQTNHTILMLSENWGYASNLMFSVKHLLGISMGYKQLKYCNCPKQACQPA